MNVETRKLPLEIKPGDFVVRAGNHEINARFTELLPCTPGQKVRGPRGGAYRLTAAGAAQYAVLVCGNKRPLVKVQTPVTVLAQDV